MHFCKNWETTEKSPNPPHPVTTKWVEGVTATVGGEGGGGCGEELHHVSDRKSGKNELDAINVKGIDDDDDDDDDHQ